MLGKCLGVFAIIPGTMLLAVSFFVLVVAEKLKEGMLRSFGNVVAMLLWVSAALLFLTAALSGYLPREQMMGKSCMLGERHKMMMHGGMDKDVMHEGMGE